MDYYSPCAASARLHAMIMKLNSYDVRNPDLNLSQRLSIPGAIRDIGYIDSAIKSVVALVVAAREAFDSGSLPAGESRALDRALEAFSALVPYENEAQP